MNRERVQELRDMMAGIPEARVRLDRVWNDDICGIGPVPEHICGTIACIAGWAMLYPPFVKQGIRRASHSIYPTDKCAAFFGVPNNGAFSQRLLKDGKGADKQIALARLDALLAGE